MSDIPDDLTTVGRHHGNDPPTETGQEVRSPSGPDPASSPAEPSPALFLLTRNAEENRIQIRVHSPQAEISLPDDGPEELGQYRTVESLRSALDEVGINGWVAVFKDANTDNLLTDSDVSPDHPWIGQSRYETITFFADEDNAAEYVDGVDQSTGPS